MQTIVALLSNKSAGRAGHITFQVEMSLYACSM